MQGLMRKPENEDIRAQILRHDGKTDEFSKFTAAYAKTAPNPVFAQDDEEDDEGQDKQK